MPHRPDIDVVVAFAERQDQVVTRRQLVAEGIGLGVIEALVSSGVLTRVLEGVFLFGGTALTQRQLLRSALLYAGPGAGLIAYSAGEQRKLRTEHYGHAMVATPRRLVRRPRMFVRMADDRPALISISRTERADFVEFDGLMVASAPRTLIEIATSRGARAARAAWREADFRGQLDVGGLRDELRSTRRRGSRVLRELMATLPPPTSSGTDFRSPDEVDFLTLVAQAGLPMPEVNVPMAIGGHAYVADFFYRQLGLVIEVDDPSHRRMVAAGRDRIRDVEFFIAGLDVLRFETHRLHREPVVCLRQLAAAIARQQRRVGAAPGPHPTSE